MQLRIESFLSGRSTGTLFEGQLLPRKEPMGVFDRYLEGLATPVGLPLFVQVNYDASSDRGQLVIKSGEVTLVQVAPICRGFRIMIMLPSEEELCVEASATA